MRRSKAHERVYLGIAVIVVAVWTVATLVQIVNPAHVVPQYANVIMAIVVTAFFGASVATGARKNGNGGNGAGRD